MTNSELRVAMIKMLNSHRRGNCSRQEAEWEMIEFHQEYMQRYTASESRCLTVFTV